MAAAGRGLLLCYKIWNSELAEEPQSWRSRSTPRPSASLAPARPSVCQPAFSCPRRRRAAQDRLLERPPHAVSVIEVAPRPGRASQLGHLAVRQDQDAYFVGEALEHGFLDFFSQ